MELPWYTPEEVKKHCTPEDVWIVHDDVVYNVTPFLDDHPGGMDMLLNYAGHDVTKAMADSNSHSHSPAALLMLSKYRIGQLAGSQTESQVACKEQKARADPRFLDLKQPLIWQLLTKSGLHRDYYLEQVHIGRHLDTPARLFHNPILERLSHTPWFAIPTVWLPIVNWFWRQASQVYVPWTLSFLYVLGIFAWTLIEYAFHRFLFHVDTRLPARNNFLLTAHFLIHGIHHFLPMDRERLVMPPALMAILSGLVWLLLRLLFPLPLLSALYSGALTGYIAYDLLHYFSHHGTPPFWSLRWLKKYHMAHHFFHPELGFGVSSPLWDRVFGTMIDIGRVQ